MSQILIIEDDSDLASDVAARLFQSGYAVTHLTTSSDVIARCDGRNFKYDLVVLDPGLSDVEEALRCMREKGLRSPVPIISVRDGLNDRVSGLNAGADDYRGKTSAMTELKPRLRARPRRSRRHNNYHQQLSNLNLDGAHRRALTNGDLLPLSRRELAVLEKPLQRTGRIVGEASLFASLYNDDSHASASAIEVYVSRPCKKLRTAHAGINIRVLRGLGYRLELAEQAKAISPQRQ